MCLAGGSHTSESRKAKCSAAGPGNDTPETSGNGCDPRKGF